MKTRPPPAKAAPTPPGSAGNARQLIDSRRQTHGDWPRTAGMAQRLKRCIADEIVRAGLPNRLADDQWEALDMILTKIARIVSGDPNHADHWDDIAGYARLARGDKLNEGGT